MFWLVLVSFCNVYCAVFWLLLLVFCEDFSFVCRGVVRSTIEAFDVVVVVVVLVFTVFIVCKIDVFF